jgi:ribonuclease HIII
MKKVVPFVSLTLNPAQERKMLDFYAPFKRENPNEYIQLSALYDGGVVNIYKKSKEGLVKAVFQGVGAVKEAQIWDPSAKNMAVQPTLPRPFIRKNQAYANRYPQIGSDEVGTGDFFGPVTVCASFVEEKDLDELVRLGVTDSKQMEDSHILEIGPTLIHDFAYSELALSNEKYNEIHDQFNMNAIKAKMHNRALLNLQKKHPEATLYMDQFAEEGLYYHYLVAEPEVARPIIFKTQGELAFPAVALSSVIARYSFLRKMQEMSKEYGVSFPFGAGPEVDRFAAAFVKRFGKEKLRQVAKLSFKNFAKLS